MHRFWPKVIRPILEAANPEVVVEVGAASGAHTRRLAKFCRAHETTLHVIDPAPRFEPSAFGDETDGFVFHRGRSLDVLPELGPVDVALLDGDHNWYTVNNELNLLRTSARSGGRPTPLALCHDVCWPYGRRDLYYDPDSIPPECRQPWERAGIVPGRSDLCRDRGLNAEFANAVREGGPRNGVMTAIEDFADFADEPLAVTVLRVLHGLAIVAPRSRLDADPRLERMVTRWDTAEGRGDLIRFVEEERQRLLAATDELKRRVAAADEATGTGPAVAAPTVGGRRFSPELPSDALARVQDGILRTTYRGRAFLKSPFDIALYLALIERLRPATVIEIGTKEAGSALWFADALSAHGIDGRVITIDLKDPPPLGDDRITFLRGDANRLREVLSVEALADLRHPFLVVEDSAHLFETCLAVLEFFHPHLRPGDYVVIEDGIVAELPGERYERYADGPNRAVSAFLTRHGDAYVIDGDLCDRYGHNVTWSPNGWLRRV